MQQNSSMQFLIELCKKTLINAARRNNNIILSQFGPQHNFIHLSRLMRHPKFICHDCDLVFSDIFEFLEHSYEKQVFDSNESWQLQYTEDKFCKLCLKYKKSKIHLIYHIVKHIEDAYNLEIPYNNSNHNERKINDTMTINKHPIRSEKLYNTEYNSANVNYVRQRSGYYNDIYRHQNGQHKHQNDPYRPQNYVTKPNRDQEKNEQHTSQFSVEETLIPSHQYRTMIPHFRVVLNDQKIAPTFIPIPVIDLETTADVESTNNRYLFH
jgi:hypothetical protein